MSLLGHLLTYLGVALAGSLGAVARLTVDTLIKESANSIHLHRRYRTHPEIEVAHPHVTWVSLGTVVVNLSGCFLAGLATGGLSHLVTPAGKATALIIGTGFLGGYTTFSTAMLDLVMVLRDSRTRWGGALAALTLGLGTLAGGIALAACGMHLTA